MDEQRDLEGLTALVTGATSGIGQAAAEELGRRGAEVIVHGRDVARGAAVAETITNEGGKARFAAADLSDPAQLDDIAEQAGAVDILVNNAGMARTVELIDMDYSRFESVMRLNAWAALRLAQLCYPAMKHKGAGVVICVASNGGLKPDPHIGAYSASKAAMRMLSMQMAQEWAVDGIRSTCIAPGLVLTDLARPLVEELGREGFPQNMQHRYANPEEIAGVALLLASQAGSYCHGETFVVDGGEMFRATT
jgi:NAD(P)-dependent dehydrogenase (short-subunit alcohol dehydrogenase family)